MVSKSSLKLEKTVDEVLKLIISSHDMEKEFIEYSRKEADEIMLKKKD
ncbi:hypothetical protein A3Q56_04659 [Intoshia linei]|uniref:Uncharacterized protein n=1 Tax=Intoshia linei TaxID=1819745 RepID=A0A177B1E5_9BILA|nr:hypothetical protein A3Q56_04659 [Intoshia linei]